MAGKNRGFTIISNFPSTVEGAFVGDDKHMEVSMNGQADEILKGIATMAAAALTGLSDKMQESDGISEKEATDKAIESFVKRLAHAMSEIKLKKMCDKIGLDPAGLEEAAKAFVERLKDMKDMVEEAEDDD